MELEERYKMLSAKLCWGARCACNARATYLHPFYILPCLVNAAGHLSGSMDLKLGRYMGNALSHATPSSLAPGGYTLHVPEADKLFYRDPLIFGYVELATQKLV